MGSGNVGAGRSRWSTYHLLMPLRRSYCFLQRDFRALPEVLKSCLHPSNQLACLLSENVVGACFVGAIM
jgi:hypothetical protein